VQFGINTAGTFWHMAAKDGPQEEYIQYGQSSEVIAPAYKRLSRVGCPVKAAACGSGHRSSFSAWLHSGHFHPLEIIH
jgi:hypothetical protein